MKKILFSLVALVCSMSMNAQWIQLMKDNKVVTTYTATQVDNVVFEEDITTGTAKRTGNIDVKWVQLWKNGPKFAEYNVGVTDGQAESFGGYYCWGSSINKDPNGTYKSGDKELTGTYDTATNLWGSNWRMPMQAELQALLRNCDAKWTMVGYSFGCKFTGRGDYASNSVFLPAAGYCRDGRISFDGSHGYYWSSTPEGEYAVYLSFSSDHLFMESTYRVDGSSVRAVLAE